MSGLIVGSAVPARASGALAGGGSLAMSGSPLAVPGEQSLLGGGSVPAEPVPQQSPQAIAERESSATRYEGLGAAASESLAGQAFPSAIETPGGGPPRLPVGARILGYPTDSAVSVELPGEPPGEARHAVLQDSEPIAVEAPGGQRVPVDLSLADTGRAFQPRTPFTGAQVSVPKQLAEGASLSEVGVSLTPVADEQGSSLSSAEGALDGATVFYAGSEDAQAGVLDLDTAIKPDTLGLSTISLLRSRRSPEKLYFKVGLPVGASLFSEGGHGAVQAMQEGTSIATIPQPLARDSEGTPVPVTMAVSGDELVVTVAHRAGSYLYPIMVDPTVQEKKFHVKNSFEAGNWEYTTDNGSSFSPSTTCGSLGCAISLKNLTVWNGEKSVPSEYTLNQYGHLSYQTQKESRVYEVTGTAQVWEEPPREHGRVEGRIAIQSSAGVTENGAETGLPSPERNVGKVTYEKAIDVCLEPGCATGSVVTSHENNVFFEVHAVEAVTNTMAIRFWKALRSVSSRKRGRRSPRTLKTPRSKVYRTPSPPING